MIIKDNTIINSVLTKQPQQELCKLDYYSDKLDDFLMKTRLRCLITALSFFFLFMLMPWLFLVNS